VSLIIGDIAMRELELVLVGRIVGQFDWLSRPRAEKLATFLVSEEIVTASTLWPLGKKKPALTPSATNGTAAQGPAR
jgi:hypothetical protein